MPKYAALIYGTNVPEGEWEPDPEQMAAVMADDAIMAGATKAV